MGPMAHEVKFTQEHTQNAGKRHLHRILLRDLLCVFPTPALSPCRRRGGPDDGAEGHGLLRALLFIVFDNNIR